MIKSTLDLRASDDREILLEKMDNNEHSPFYSEIELKKYLNLDSNDLGDEHYFNELLSILGNQQEITTGGPSFPDSYVLPNRLSQHSLNHPQRIL